MKKLLTTLGVAGTLASVSAQEIKPNVNVMNETPKTIITQHDSINKKVADTLNRFDVNGGDFTGGEGVGIVPDPVLPETDEGEGVGIEPDPVLPDDAELEPTDGGKDTGKEQVSKTKFVVSTGVGYDLGNGLFMMNRISGNGTFFTGTKGEIRAYAHIDYDDPMHSKGSGKLSLGKTIYKGISLEGDYTFTGTGGNSVRVGLGYAGKLGDGQYAINVYPLNSSLSPVTFKVSFGTPLGKHGYLSTFVNGDYNKLKNLGYYSETKYSHDISNLINGVALFAQLRLGGTLDGQFTDNDFQSIRVGFDISVK